MKNFQRSPNLEKDDLNKTLVGVVEAVDPFLVRNSEDEKFEILIFASSVIYSIAYMFKSSQNDQRRISHHARIDVVNYVSRSPANSITAL